MKTRWWLLLLVFVFAAGWFGGSASSSSQGTTTSPQQAANTARPADGPASAPRESSSKRWAEKLVGTDAGELPATFKEIPAKNRGAALDAWLAAPGNRVLDEEKMLRFRNLLDAWVAEDADAAEAWATAQGEPSLRELAMGGVACSLVAKDTRRAYECLVAHGPFKNGISDSRLSSMMSELSQEALKQGPAALAELWKKLPEFAASSSGGRYGISLACPPGTDFRALSDAMKGVAGYDANKLVGLSGISGEWMKQDPEAATAYLAERIAAKEKVWHSWQEMYYYQKNQVGVPAADQWVCTMVKDLPGDARGKFLVESDFLGSDGRVLELVKSPETAGWISEALEFAAEQGNWSIERTLGPLSDEQKIEYLKGLRGTKALQNVVPVMSTWNFSESQKAEVLKAIKGE